MSASIPLGSFLDRQPCRYGTSRLLFRGPGRSLNGRHIAFVGGSETLGPSLSQAYPDLIEEQLGETCVNFGQRNGSIDVAMHDPLIGTACRDALLTVLSVTGAVNMSNRFYSVHPRRNDRFTKPSAALQSLYPEVDFAQICFTRHLVGKLHDVSPSRFERVREELQAAWTARMRTFIERIGPEIILAWFAPHPPPTQEELASQGLQLMQEPTLVTLEMLTGLRPLVRNLVIVPPAPPSNSLEPLGLTAHRNAADALATPIEEVIRARRATRIPEPFPPAAVTVKRSTAAMEGHLAAGPVVQTGTSPPGDRPIDVPRDVELPREEHGHRQGGPVSIAVLPFRVFAPDGAAPAFADMLAEDIAGALHRQHGVEVRLPPAVADHRMTLDDIELLRKGELSHVLVGSVAVMGRDIRLTAKLLDLGLGCFVWIEHFNRPLPQSLQAVVDLGHEVVTGALSIISEIDAAGSRQ